MENITKNIQTLKDNGLDNKKIEKLFNLCIDDFLLELSEDIVNLSQEDQDEINNTLNNISLGDMLNNRSNPIVEVITKMYGISSKHKLITFIDKYFEDAVSQTDTIKNFIKKLESKDPEALQRYQDSLNNPDIKELEKYMKSIE